MAKFDHFNFLSPVYDLVFGRASQSAIINLADIKPHHSVLDVGGGTGRVAVQMISLAKSTIIADSALKMLREAQKKGISAINANAEQLPFENGAFDRIIMVDALHHVADQEQTLNELWRSLKPDGILIIEEPDIDHWFVKLIALGEKLLLMRSHFLRPQEIKAMCCFIDIKSMDIRSDKGIAWIIMHKDNHLDKKD
jgi:ubiquinone/menaquinone biosynthesis C-methylase UbiE